MSSFSYKTKMSSAAREKRDNTNQAQDHTGDHSKVHQDIPVSAYEYHQQKNKEHSQGDKNTRHEKTASTLTFQAMTRFEHQLHNKLQALNDRVMDYRKPSPITAPSDRSPKERQSQMADNMKAWSDEWERLEGK